MNVWRHIAAALLGALIACVVWSRRLIRARHKPAETKLRQIVKETTRDDVQRITEAHSNIFNGNRDSLAGRVIDDLERIRRERDKRKQ